MGLNITKNICCDVEPFQGSVSIDHHQSIGFTYGYSRSTTLWLLIEERIL